LIVNFTVLMVSIAWTARIYDIIDHRSESFATHFADGDVVPTIVR